VHTGHESPQYTIISIIVKDFFDFFCVFLLAGKWQILEEFRENEQASPEAK